MAVDTPADSYTKYYDMWIDMRNAKEGERAVKKGGTRYLPMLGGQNLDDDGNRRYAAYKLRATFYNATGRTIDSMSGMVFRKPPIIKRPTALDQFVEDVTLAGIPLQGFAEHIVDELLTVGRIGVLIDLPEMPDDVRTLAEADRANIRPFWSHYSAENIINWRTGRIGNRTILTQVRLWESVDQYDGDDEFEEDYIDQIRVLDLAPISLGDEDEAPSTLVYRQRLFRRNPMKKEEWVQFGADIYPTVNNSFIPEIPFFFFGIRDTSPNIERPPLMDVAEINFSHYRTTADLEHGAHFTALPTPYCFGIDTDKAPSEIGPEVLWTSDDENITAGLLEFSGAGLNSLEKRLESKEHQMAALGARLLAPDKKMVEAAETAAIHRSGEISVLSSIAQAVSIGLTQLLTLTRDWMIEGNTDEVSVMLNRDYLPTQMSPQLLTSLIQAVQSGKISQKTFFDNLQRGEIIDPDKEFEKEQQEIEEDGGAGLGGLNGPPSGFTF